MVSATSATVSASLVRVSSKRHCSSASSELNEFPPSNGCATIVTGCGGCSGARTLITRGWRVPSCCVEGGGAPLPLARAAATAAAAAAKAVVEVVLTPVHADTVGACKLGAESWRTGTAAYADGARPVVGAECRRGVLEQRGWADQVSTGGGNAGTVGHASSGTAATGGSGSPSSSPATPKPRRADFTTDVNAGAAATGVLGRPGV